VTVSGTVPFHVGQEVFETWYRIDGDLGRGDRLPLIALHGGPGGTHDYLLPLTELAREDRGVILYDQLGSGNSTHLPGRESEFWTVELFVRELENLVNALGIGDHHLLGQSWGGCLAQEYALTQPAGLRSLVLADTFASFPDFVAECYRLRADLPPNVEATLSRHEQDGTTDDPAYQAACQVFYRRHLCRLHPWPAEFVATMTKLEADQEVYRIMNGPSDFYVTGVIRAWQAKNRLGAIDVPTLIVSGRYDEATPALQETLRDGIAGSEWVLFEHSAHLPHLEERARYLEVLGARLERCEASAAG
jgi:L-proline amide hydrolase